MLQSVAYRTCKDLLVENFAKLFCSIDAVISSIVCKLPSFAQINSIITLADRNSVMQPFESPVFDVLALNVACKNCFFLHKFVFRALFHDFKVFLIENKR